MRHVLRLPQQVPWTGQPGRTTGLERLGFYGDTWAALRAGLRAALRAGLRAALRTGPPGHATRRAAGQCYAPGRRAALRAGPLAALHAGPTTAPPCRWTFGPTDGRRRYIPMDIEDPRPWSLQPDSCTVRWDYARGSDSAMLESTTHRWTGQLGPRHPPAPARTCSHSWLGTRAGAGGATWANPGWNWWKAETTAGRARTGRALDVGVMGK